MQLFILVNMKMPKIPWQYQDLLSVEEYISSLTDKLKEAESIREEILKLQPPCEHVNDGKIWRRFGIKETETERWYNCIICGQNYN